MFAKAVKGIMQNPAGEYCCRIFRKLFDKLYASHRQINIQNKYTKLLIREFG
jgi:hypothetical protein